VRYDRGQYTVPIWWGLALSGIYVLTEPQILTRITDRAENALAAALLLSAVVCLTGTRIPDTRTAYRVELVGLAGIVVVLGVLAVATDLTVWQQFTLAGGLGALVQIGSIRMIVNLTRALRTVRK